MHFEPAVPGLRLWRAVAIALALRARELRTDAAQVLAAASYAASGVGSLVRAKLGV